MNTIKYGIGGIILIIVIACAGCGSVTPAQLETDSGAAGMAADGSAGMGSAGKGTAGAAPGTAGAPAGRPLGAGCTGDNQCGSGICDGATQACCDGHASECGACVGGYLTAKPDGTSCGAAEACAGTDRTKSACASGACALKVIKCATATCDKEGRPITCAGTGMCAIENDPCYCIDTTGSGRLTYPCP